MNRLVVGAVVLYILSGCAPSNETTTAEVPLLEATAAVSMSPAQSLPMPVGPVLQRTTQNDLSGNHIVRGSIDLQSAPSIDIPLDGIPLWLVSAPQGDSVIFAAILENGQSRGFRISGQQYQAIKVSAGQLPAGTPPLLIISGDEIQLIAPPQDASPLTNPVIVGGTLVYIASNGDIVLLNSPQEIRLPIHALPDSRILVDENNRLLVLTEPSDRYGHGVLGDRLEATAITLLETSPEPRVLQTIAVPESDVIEGLSAIWADIDNDGSKEVIVTLSNDANGARIAAFRVDGSLLAESDPVGTGYRWRHQIAVARFEADEPVMLVAVRTPHIGGIVEFFRYNHSKLEIVKEVKGFSTHSVGSRNLDSALAGDFNNDGAMELLAPDQAYKSLAIISMNGALAAISLNGQLTSNLSATNLNGKLYVGAGTRDNLRIWIP